MTKTALMMIKPDAVRRDIHNAILACLPIFQLELVNLQRRKLTRQEAGALYVTHCDKEYFSGLIDFTISGEVLLMEVRTTEALDLDASQVVRGAVTKIREMFGTYKVTRENVIHGSDSEESARREVKLFFPKSIDAY